MYTYPIIADTPGGVTATLANQANQREAAMRQALGMVLARQQENQRRRELQAVMQERELQNKIANDYRNRAFLENVRQFNESLKLSREAPPARPLSPTELGRVVESGYDIPDEQWQAYLDQLTKAGRLSLDQAGIADLNRRQLRTAGFEEHARQAQAADTLNLDPRRRALLAEQTAVAENYKPTGTLGNVLQALGGLPGILGLAAGWTPFRGRPAIASEIEAGVANQARELDQRRLRAEDFRKQLLQNPVSGDLSAGSLPPAGMQPWSRRIPVAPMTGTNAPVINLPPTAVSVTRTNAPSVSPRLVQQGRYIFSINPDGTATFVGTAQ